MGNILAAHTGEDTGDLIPRLELALSKLNLDPDDMRRRLANYYLELPDLLKRYQKIAPLMKPFTEIPSYYLINQVNIVVPEPSLNILSHKQIAKAELKIDSNASRPLPSITMAFEVGALINNKLVDDDKKALDRKKPAAWEFGINTGKSLDTSEKTYHELISLVNGIVDSATAIFQGNRLLESHRAMINLLMSEDLCKFYSHFVNSILTLLIPLIDSLAATEDCFQEVHLHV